MTSWLQKHRKVDLNSLAEESGLKGASSMRKDELVEALDKHIQANSTRLATTPTFDGYFKPEPVSEGENKTPKPRVRRVTKGPGDETDLSPEGVAGAIVARTPRSVQRTVARAPLPPSPSAVTDLVERQTGYVTERAAHYWDESGITEYAEATREALSTVVGIQTVGILIEAYGLARAVLPYRYAFTVPGFRFITSIPVSLPDFFLMLTADFWGPTSLWTATSVAIPLAVAWFFNLTLHASKRKVYAVDPLTFSVAKALTSWLVYGQHWPLGGLVNLTTVLRVDAAVPGGWFGILLASTIAVIASVYEAALRK